jgi:hypothetical protein
MSGEIFSQTVSRNILDRLDAMANRLRERGIDIIRLDSDFLEMRCDLFSLSQSMQSDLSSLSQSMQSDLSSLSQSMRRDMATVRDVMEHMQVAYVGQITALLYRVSRLEQRAEA